MSSLRLLSSRGLALRQNQLSHQSRRTYASGPAPDPSKGSSNSTWMVITAALALPAAYYLMQDKSGGAPPSAKDQPASRKAPAGTGSISSKQEGLDNADTSNPFVNEPGKSVKGEGETETAKLKGTVSPERPQQ